MSSAILQSRCQGCGGQFVADLTGQQSHCPHCGRQESLETKGRVEELDLEALLLLEEEQSGAPLAEFSLLCQSCGARTAHPAQMKVVDCPFRESYSPQRR